jgi:thiamine pyrophosphokinase
MRMKHETIVVVAGGHPLWAPGPGLPAAAMVIAADGGVDSALALGLRVDVAIGDFDSVSRAGLATVEAAGARIERHPAAKDATDLELALDAALALQPDRIVVVGSSGGRLDHLVAGLLMLGLDRYAAVHVDALLGDARAAVIRGTHILAGTPGELVSLLPLHGAAEGVTTEGLEYPLQGETLPAGSSRGVSNVFTATEARITIERGCLLAVCPGAERQEIL